MKKRYLFTSLILILAIISAAFSGCKSKSDTEQNNEINVIHNAMNISVNNKTLDAKTLEAEMGAFSGGKGTVYETLFEQPVKINTIILQEGSENAVKSFTVEAEINGEYTPIYEQDAVGHLRYCAFDTVTTNGFRIIVNDAGQDGQFQITSTEAYCIEREKREFRITSYLIGSEAYKKEYFNTAALNVVTDIIVFGLMSFDCDGNIIYNDITVDGKSVSGKDALNTVLGNIRGSAAELGKNIMIHINLLGPDADGTYEDWDGEMIAKGDMHALAFKDNREKLIASITALLDEYSLDGIYFDYEYPIKDKHKKAYSSFLAELKKNIPEKVLGAALAKWCCDLSSAAKNALDRVEIMAYDEFDSSGNHSSFYASVSAIDAFLGEGYEKEKLSLGIPFYARPADRGAFWYCYSLEADRLGKFKNFVTGSAPAADDKCETRYYNSYQMTYDKTAYAYDTGIGGVMIWHMNCDLRYNSELSLFKAIFNTVQSR